MKKLSIILWLLLIIYPAKGYAYSEEDHYCLTEAIYFEARSESHVGQLAIANVILERVRQETFPSTICDVVHQWDGYPYRHACSFSYYCDGKKEIMYEKDALIIAMDIATLALEGAVIEDIWGATHYHTRYTRPYWVAEMFRLGAIGNHIFYERNY
tara:strand:+ start:190 stop:657 length:468 start_codon:yes stop_codon:yes gene_type:complete